METVLDYSVEFLKVHPRNNEFYDDISGEDYEQFKATIQNEGVLTPLIVAPDMTVISGHQRLKASKDLNLTSIPIIIRQDIKTEEDKMAVLLATNFGRPDTAKKKRKIADEYDRLRGKETGRPKKDCDIRRLSKKEIAKELGVSERTLYEMLDIERKLTPEFKEMLDTGMFTETTASKILVKLSPDEQEKLITTYGKEIIEGVTQKQMQKYVDKIREIKEEKEREIKSIKAEYELELAVIKNENEHETGKNENDEIIIERDELKLKLRKQYEESQQLMEKIEKTKNDITEMDELKEKLEDKKKEAQQLQKVIEDVKSNVKNSDEYKSLKAELERQMLLNKSLSANEIEHNPDLTYEAFNQYCVNFITEITPYVFTKEKCKSMRKQEINKFVKAIEYVETNLINIKLNLKEEK